MKRKITLITLLLTLVLLIWDVNNSYLMSNDTGAPVTVTGSPADAQTCAKSNCHTGNAVTATPGIITSNIPASGYLPGSTYTITATVAQTGISTWGFEISPQDLSGNLMGTLVITNTTETKFATGSNKYVTHKMAGITGAGTKTWSFNWIAPAAGTGDVTFYGAFNYANGNGQRTGDFIHTSTMTVSEFTVGIHSGDAEKSFSVFPNPLQSGTQISLYLDEPSPLRITMLSNNGQVVAQLADEKSIEGSYIYTVSDQFKPGVYLLKLETQKGITVKKVVVL